MNRPITIHNGGKAVLWISYVLSDVVPAESIELSVGGMLYLPDAPEVLSIGAVESGRDDDQPPDPQ